MRSTLLTLFLCCPVVVIGNELITIGMINYPPFYDTSGEGLYSDIYRAAFAEVGITVEVVAVPIPRGRMLLLNHEIDALSVGSLFVRPEERARLLSVPILNLLPSLFFYRPRFEDPESLVQLLHG